MIAKRIMRGKAGDFGRLGEYIIHGPQSGGKSRQTGQHFVEEEMAIWQRTADYIVDAVGGGMRASAVRITNCETTTDIEMAIIEIIATQKMNLRARSDRTYHLVVSFPPGEKPTPVQLADIEDELCKAIGLGAHQRISAVHTDTEHLHIHIAINKVHPEKLTCVEPWQDRPKLMAACERLEIKHGLTRTNHQKVHVVTPHGADAMERYGAGSSLLQWLREEVRPKLLQVLENGKGWQDFHALLRDHGLELRRRGAGLVIAKSGGRIAVKASNIDKMLAMKALADRWGAFVRPDPEIANRAVKYRREPMYRDVDELFEDWLRMRDERNVAMEELNRQIQARDDATNKYYREAVQGVHRLSPLNSLGRQGIITGIRGKRDGYRRNTREWADAERKKILATLPTWPDFLREAALLGNATALRTLRRNARRFQKALTAVISQDASPNAKATITTELKPETQANGHVAYRLRDGGKVFDDGKTITINTSSHGALSLSLVLTAARAPGQGIVITQPDQQANTIKAAARDKLNVYFKDQTAEQERQRLLLVFEREDAMLASAIFVARMNAERANKPEILEHRLWGDVDVGEAIFERVEELGEDSYAAVLRRNDEILVKPLIAAEVSTFSGHAPGDVIQMLPPPEAQPTKPVVEEAQAKPKKSWWRR